MHVLGLGISAYVADHLSHQLGLVGVTTHRVACDPVQAAIGLSSVTARDAVVAISVWRYLNATIAGFNTARTRGATTIAITDSKASAVARQADFVLVADTETPELGHSVTAMITLTNVIATGVTLADSPSSLKRLQDVEELFAQWDVLSK